MPMGQFKAMWQCSDAIWWPTLEAMQVVQSVHIAPSGDQNVQTMDEASYRGKIFYLQMEGGTV